MRDRFSGWSSGRENDVFGVEIGFDLARSAK
jgi:hypothetical protein